MELELGSRVYFIGMSGAGMRSLALYMSDAGYEVSGSDSGAGEEEVGFWGSRGVRLYTEQVGDNLDGAGIVAYSSAVPPHNPERSRAEKEGRAITRGALLARLANAHRFPIAVCGTHGKGTVAGGVAHMLRGLGCSVGDILGAVPVGRELPSRYEPDSEYLVCEVDESDRTHLGHRPKLLIINNVEADHLNEYASLDEIVASFACLVAACVRGGGRALVHLSGVGAHMLYEMLSNESDGALLSSITWIRRVDDVGGYKDGGCLKNEFIYTIDYGDDGYNLIKLCTPKDAISTFTSGLAGEANASNWAVMVAAGALLGFSPSDAAFGLCGYGGLADRCQSFDVGGIEFVTDYASHPTCVANDISLLRRRHHDGRVIAMYHPFRYSLMGYHQDALVRALALADEVIVLPFDSCGEQPVAGVSSESIARGVVSAGGRASAYAALDECMAALGCAAAPGDAVIIFAGGHIFRLARRAISS